MKKIVCLGDSITAGGACFEGRRWTAVLQKLLDADFPEQFAVYNRGIGGNTSGQGVERFATDVKSVEPDFVLLEFGFNDASIPEGRKIPRVNQDSFRENLIELIRLTRECKAQPVLLTNNPIVKNRKSSQGNGKSYYVNFKPYQPIIREVAAKQRVPLIDLEKEMSKTPLNRIVSEDGLHLSIGGNRIYAECVYAGLKTALAR